MANFRPRPLYSSYTTPAPTDRRTPDIISYVCRDSNPGSSSLVAVPMTLTRLHIDGEPSDVLPFVK